LAPKPDGGGGTGRFLTGAVQSTWRKPGDVLPRLARNSRIIRGLAPTVEGEGPQASARGSEVAGPKKALNRRCACGTLHSVFRFLAVVS